MALISCPECGKLISNQAISCPGCGYPMYEEANSQYNYHEDAISDIYDTDIPFQIERNPHKSVIPLFVVGIAILAIGVIVVFMWMNQNPYRIHVPQHAKIKNEEIINYLGDSNVNMIEEYIPMVAEWYNSVNIKKDVPLNFTDEAVDSLGKRIFQYNNYDLMDEHIKPVVSIPYKISAIILESEVEISIPLNGESEGETLYHIKDEDWKELGDTITEASEYYFK